MTRKEKRPARTEKRIIRAAERLLRAWNVADWSFGKFPDNSRMLFRAESSLRNAVNADRRAKGGRRA